MAEPASPATVISVLAGALVELIRWVEDAGGVPSADARRMAATICFLAFAGYVMNAECAYKDSEAYVKCVR
jgi:hypothetical protein